MNNINKPRTQKHSLPLGEKLRKARLEKKMTPSQVASATRVLAQIIEDIEREDFHRIAAPIYAKGFIKMYAEEVGLDPKPLIDEYISRFVCPEPPSIGGKPDSISISLPEEEILSKTESAVDLTKGKKEADLEKRPSLFNKISTFMASKAPVADTAPSGPRHSSREEEITEPVKSVPEPHETQELKTDAVPKEQEKELDLFSRIERGNIDLGTRAAERAPVIDFSAAENYLEKLKDAIVFTCVNCFKTSNRKLKHVVTGLRESSLKLNQSDFTVTPVKYISVGAGILIILVFLFSSMYSCGGREKTGAVVTSSETIEGLRVATAPPDSYLD